MVKSTRTLSSYSDLPLRTPVYETMRDTAYRRAAKMKLDMDCIRLIEKAKTLGDLEAALQFARARKDAIKAATELFYDDECIEAIKKAKDPGTLERALIAGRHRLYA